MARTPQPAAVITASDLITPLEGTAVSLGRESELDVFAATSAHPGRFAPAVDAVARDGLRVGLPTHASLSDERAQRRDGDMARVDLKKAAKRRTRIAAAKSVRAERGEWRLYISRDQLRIGAHIIRRGDDRTWPRKTAGDVACLVG